jgi:hypothetical protein
MESLTVFKEWRRVMQVATIPLVSFAIQQFLQLLDPLLSRIPGLHNDNDPTAAANAKKAVMGLLSFGLGLILVQWLPDLLVLKPANVNVTAHPFLDPFISALVVGAGTEASNTVQKLLSYTKDKIKPDTTPK